jgi:sporulation protein YlmC with PRC-barrel domain
MSIKISELYGMEIYTSKAKHLGKVEDIILNLQKGEIMRLTLAPLKSGLLSKSKVEEILKENSIGYQDVDTVGDIVLVKPNVRVSLGAPAAEKPSHRH